MTAPDGVLVVDKPAGLDVARRRRPRAAGSRARARSATPARSTRWRPACWCSASAGRPGCSGTWPRPTRVRRHDPARRRPRSPTTPRARSSRPADASGLDRGRHRPCAPRRAHRRHRAGAVGRVGDQGQRQARLRAGPRRRGGRAAAASGHGRRVRRPRDAATGLVSTSTCGASARRAPTSARWPATSAPPRRRRPPHGLRRTASGHTTVEDARTLDGQSDDSFTMTPIAEAARACFPGTSTWSRRGRHERGSARALDVRLDVLTALFRTRRRVPRALRAALTRPRGRSPSSSDRARGHTAQPR